VRTPFDSEDSEASDAESGQSGEPSVPEVSAPEPSVPEVSAPEVSAPEPPSPDVDYADADSGLKVLFWKLVFFYKFSILGTSLGALFLVFEPGSGVGLPLLAGGLALLGYTLYQTRRGKQRIDAGEFDSHEGDGVDASGGPDEGSENSHTTAESEADAAPSATGREGA
jgi:hypothetical protein